MVLCRGLGVEICRLTDELPAVVHVVLLVQAARVPTHPGHHLHNNTWYLYISTMVESKAAFDAISIENRVNFDTANPKNSYIYLFFVVCVAI